MKQKPWLLAIVLFLLLVSCKKDIGEPASQAFATQATSANGNPHLKIAVVSDIHYLLPSLLTNNGAAGQAFQDYLNQDPKLVEYSDAIFQTVLAKLIAEKPDLVLVPGDITKDGERAGHEAMVSYFNTLLANGTKVYVLPGNHDINNNKAARYDGQQAFPVPTIQASEFASLYANFGYSNALDRDPNSLSYLVQPVEGMWIIAIDASTYEEYGPEGDVADGRLKPATLTWVLAKLAQAKAQNITVLGMMHHNLVEHYAGQSYLDPGYVVEDWQNVANELVDAGLNLIFTGHYHANDVTAYTHNGKTLYDVETGSLVSPVSPFRLVTMKNKRLEIRTENVRSIGVPLPGGLSFTAYSDLFINQHLDGYFSYLLQNRFGVPADLTAFAAPLFRNAIKAHFAGDEKMPPDQRKQIAVLASMAPTLADMVTALWTDLGVKDNDLTLAYQ